MKAISPNNMFISYIIQRLQSNNYRGMHISQHNRYNLEVISEILKAIKETCNKNLFVIPPGDYDRTKPLEAKFSDFQNIVDVTKAKIGRGTINSIKKNFFPDLEKMGFLDRTRIPAGRNTVNLCGKLTEDAFELLNTTKLVEKHKMYSDGIDNLLGQQISELADTIYLSDYAEDIFNVYEFMFIFSDDTGENKIKLLDAYRDLERYKRNKLISLIDDYATPENFTGNKKDKRDFHNWKNQAQQILNLLSDTVYFNVYKQNRTPKEFSLNSGSTGFYQSLQQRKTAPKNRYFQFHGIQKRDDFELHHIVPIKSAKNPVEAKQIDDYRNLIYIHKNIHREFTTSQYGNLKVVLNIDPVKATFTDFNRIEMIEAINDQTAIYSQDQGKLKKLADYNIGLLKSIFGF